MSQPEDKEGFLGRWSRLKTGSAEPEPNPAEPAPAGALTRPDDDEGDPEVVAALPDIETLDKDSDYAVFLQEGVPDRLKTLALRKLWQSDPVLANLDGLNDYDDDFGAILREGAAYMRKLVEAGERMTRPGAEEPSETEGQTADAQAAAGAEPDDGASDSGALSDNTEVAGEADDGDESPSRPA